MKKAYTFKIICIVLALVYVVTTTAGASPARNDIHTISSPLVRSTEHDLRNAYDQETKDFSLKPQTASEPVAIKTSPQRTDTAPTIRSAPRTRVSFIKTIVRFLQTLFFAVFFISMAPRLRAAEPAVTRPGVTAGTTAAVPKTKSFDFLTAYVTNKRDTAYFQKLIARLAAEAHLSANERWDRLNKESMVFTVNDIVRYQTKKSPAGAYGLTQIMPVTARYLYLTEPIYDSTGTVIGIHEYGRDRIPVKPQELVNLESQRDSLIAERDTLRAAIRQNAVKIADDQKTLHRIHLLPLPAWKNDLQHSIDTLTDQTQKYDTRIRQIADSLAALAPDIKTLSAAYEQEMQYIRLMAFALTLPDRVIGIEMKALLLTGPRDILMDKELNLIYGTVLELITRTKIQYLIATGALPAEVANIRFVTDLMYNAGLNGISDVLEKYGWTAKTVAHLPKETRLYGMVYLINNPGEHIHTDPQEDIKMRMQLLAQGFSSNRLGYAFKRKDRNAVQHFIDRYCAGKTDLTTVLAQIHRITETTTIRWQELNPLWENLAPESFARRTIERLTDFDLMLADLGDQSHQNEKQPVLHALQLPDTTAPATQKTPPAAAPQKTETVARAEVIPNKASTNAALLLLSLLSTTVIVYNMKKKKNGRLVFTTTAGTFETDDGTTEEATLNAHEPLSLLFNAMDGYVHAPLSDAVFTEMIHRARDTANWDEPLTFLIRQTKNIRYPSKAYGDIIPYFVMHLMHHDNSLKPLEHMMATLRQRSLDRQLVLRILLQYYTQEQCGAFGITDNGMIDLVTLWARKAYIGEKGFEIRKGNEIADIKKLAGRITSTLLMRDYGFNNFREVGESSYRTVLTNPALVEQKLETIVKLEEELGITLPRAGYLFRFSASTLEKRVRALAVAGKRITTQSLAESRTADITVLESTALQAA